jgi:hypothetical protein
VCAGNPNRAQFLRSCNVKPRAATLKMYLNVQPSSAERLQRTLFVSVSAPKSPISNRKEKT